MQEFLSRYLVSDYADTEARADAPFLFNVNFFGTVHDPESIFLGIFESNNQWC